MDLSDFDVEFGAENKSYIDDLLSNDFSGAGKEKELDVFQMTFLLPIEQKETMDKFLASHKTGKEEIVAAIVDFICKEVENA